jgi:choline monooxygenase
MTDALPKPLPPFEPDLAKASTLPAWTYTHRDVLAVEQRRIFARTWQPIGATADVAEPGSFLTAEVAGAPILVVRDAGRNGGPPGSGELRAFYNVCRHRAGPLAEGCGRRKTLTCRYHGWTYALDGRLLATPEFDGVQGFDKATNGLLPVRVAVWGPFVFVNLTPPDEPCEPLESVLGAIPAEAAPYALETMTRGERRDYVVACNWKVYVDNYLEGYHLPVVHPGLNRELDYAQYRVETFRRYSRQHAPIRPGNPDAKVQRQYAGTTSEPMSALYYWVFPNWMVNVYPDNVSINIVVPQGPDETLTIFEWYFRPDVLASKEARERVVSFGDEIQHEDIAICEAVQKRLGSGVYDRGRFSVARENGVHHFQGLVLEHLGCGA